MKPESTFRLYRNLRAGQGAQDEYCGRLDFQGKIYWIEAHVVSHQKADGTEGRHFEGVVIEGVSSPRKPKAEKPPDDDLIALAEGTPFNDPLPGPPF